MPSLVSADKNFVSADKRRACVQLGCFFGPFFVDESSKRSGCAQKRLLGCPMSKRRWGAWLGVAAVAVGMLAAGPARAEGPRGKAAAAASAEVEEARRLNEEALRLHEQGKYEEALPRAQRALAILEK